MPMTDFFMLPSFASLADFQLTIHLCERACSSPSVRFDRAAFGLGDDRAAQCDLAVDGDDLDVLGREGQGLILHQRLPYLLSDLAIRFAASLIHRCERGAAAIAGVDPRVVG